MSTDDPVKTLMDKLEKSSVCMLTTVEEDGSLVSRPMAIQDVEEDHTIWFITRVTTPKVEEAAGGRQVNVAVAEKGFWASISGTATVVRDVERKKEYWSKTIEAFFGDSSPEDVDIVLLKVDPSTGEYWDSPGAPATAFEVVKGMVSKGERAQPGDNETVEL